MRLRPVGLLLLGIVAASSACSMDATAPSSLAAPTSAAMEKGAAGFGVSGKTARDQFAGATVHGYRVTIDPQRANLLHFGPHTLEIPARAICDESGGYGVDTFDLDCKSEKKRVTITAVVRATANGVQRIDLLPEMRFSPSQTVTLTLFVPHLSAGSSAWTILYCATQTPGVCIDESTLDPELVTHVDYQAKTVFRRIKHFSGYFVES